MIAVERKWQETARRKIFLAGCEHSRRVVEGSKLRLGVVADLETDAHQPVRWDSPQPGKFAPFSRITPAYQRAESFSVRAWVA